MTSHTYNPLPTSNTDVPSTGDDRRAGEDTPRTEGTGGGAPSRREATRGVNEEAGRLRGIAGDPR